MFLVTPWNWTAVFPPGFAIATSWQTRAERNAASNIGYLYPNLMVYLSPLVLPEPHTLFFDVASHRGVNLDTGGASVPYLEAHPEVRVRRLSPTPELYNAGNPLFTRAAWSSAPSETRERLARNVPLLNVLFPANPSESGLGYLFIVDFAILHFRAASEWDHKDAHLIDIQWTRISQALDQAFRLQEQDQLACGSLAKAAIAYK